MSVETYARGGYVSNTSSVPAFLPRGCEFLTPKRDVVKWGGMTDQERLAWIDEAKNHTHCACGNPRFHLAVTC